MPLDNSLAPSRVISALCIINAQSDMNNSTVNKERIKKLHSPQNGTSYQLKAMDGYYRQAKAIN
jgi:hypothetical protein